ncbi:hypothetical protein D6774_01280 [Candidatus Woesearchaeota archaeon]|nr:MAG: hypothetical protein D6774_01280 [Candidatus Woesearchaeota archaeon]
MTSQQKLYIGDLKTDTHRFRNIISQLSHAGLTEKLQLFDEARAITEYYDLPSFHEALQQAHKNYIRPITTNKEHSQHHAPRLATDNPRNNPLNNSINNSQLHPYQSQALQTHQHPQPPQLLQTPHLTLDDVADAIESRGVYEERDNAKLLALCYVSGLHVGVEGASGTGKSHLVNAFLDCLDEHIYTCSLSSPTATYYDENITTSTIIYFSELQKAGRDKTLIEMIKDLSEGKESIRKVTRGQQTHTLRIPAGKQLIYTLADENNYTLDHELSRRFIRLKTNTTEEAIRKRKEAILTRTPQQPLNISHLLKNIKETQLNVQEAHPQLILNLLPNTSKTISLMQHYCALIKAHAKFAGRDHTTPQDHLNTYNLFAKRFEEQLSQLENKEITLNAEVLHDLL